MTKEERNELVLENMGLVKSRVACLYRKVHVDESIYEDLVQAGAIGLIKGLDHYNPDRGANFSTYCVPWIDSEIRKFCNENRIIHIPAQLYRQVLEYKTLKTDSNLSQEEIMEALNISRERADYLFGLSNLLTTESDNEGNTKDQRRYCSPEIMFIHKETRKELNDALDALTEMEKKVLCSVYGYKMEKKTAKKIGEENNTSRQTISAIRKRALKKMKGFMTYE